jgi:threonyl-tRNA synthetase
MIVKLPDGRIVEHPGKAALKDVLATTNKELLATTVGAKLDGEIVDFHRVLPEGAQVELIPVDSPRGLRSIAIATRTSWPKRCAGSSPGSN